jgi:hypothetical protein
LTRTSSLAVAVIAVVVVALIDHFGPGFVL